MKAAHRPIAWIAIALSSWLALSACGQAPAATSSVQPAAASASAGAQPAKPPASASTAAASSTDWDNVVAAGKREGKVSLIGPPGDQVRSALVDAFQKQYGITIDYNAMSGSAATSKVALERNASQYNWDVLIAGATGTLATLIPMKAMAPMEPQLILPEVKDPKNWRGGAVPLIGPNHEILVMTPYQRGTLFYNKNLLKGDEIKSYKDLLDAKWKDKLQMDDPRRPGPGQATFIFFYLHPDLGPDYIRALAKQNITIQNDYQQEIDMIGQGKTPLMIGAVDYLAEARIKQGAPIGIVPAPQLKEGTDISAASGDVAVFNNAPHPNATKVYVNWLLTKDAQTALAKANDFTDARADVNADWTEPWRTPQPNAIETDGDVAIQVNPKLLPLLKEVLPS
ncbi:MAG TPA: extracellular solute-binding protein [Chloroflexota bacterium]